MTLSKIRNYGVRIIGNLRIANNCKLGLSFLSEEEGREKYVYFVRLLQLLREQFIFVSFIFGFSIFKVVMFIFQEKEYEKKDPNHLAEDLAFRSDFSISQLCSKYTSTQQFCLDERIALESGKFKELDRLLPDIKRKVFFLKFDMNSPWLLQPKTSWKNLVERMSVGER